MNKEEFIKKYGFSFKLITDMQLSEVDGAFEKTLLSMAKDAISFVTSKETPIQ